MFPPLPVTSCPPPRSWKYLPQSEGFCFVLFDNFLRINPLNGRSLGHFKRLSSSWSTALPRAGGACFSSPAGVWFLPAEKPPLGRGYSRPRRGADCPGRADPGSVCRVGLATRRDAPRPWPTWGGATRTGVPSARKDVGARIFCLRNKGCRCPPPLPGCRAGGLSVAPQGPPVPSPRVLVPGAGSRARGGRRWGCVRVYYNFTPFKRKTMPGIRGGGEPGGEDQTRARRWPSLVSPGSGAAPTPTPASRAGHPPPRLPHLCPGSSVAPKPRPHPRHPPLPPPPPPPAPVPPTPALRPRHPLPRALAPPPPGRSEGGAARGRLWAAPRSARTCQRAPGGCGGGAVGRRPGPSAQPP